MPLFSFLAGVLCSGLLTLLSLVRLVRLPQLPASPHRGRDVVETIRYLGVALVAVRGPC